MEPKRTKLGNQVGVILCLVGLVLVWVGWNGAASYDRSTQQFPYLLSGGIAGLCLCVIGVGLFIVQSQRAERAALERNLAGLSRILETLVELSAGMRVTGEGLVLGGTSAYHRPSCHLLDDHPKLRTMTVDAASDEGLAPCRACEPPMPAVQLPG